MDAWGEQYDETNNGYMTIHILGSTHSKKDYDPALFNERRPKAKPAGDVLYLDSLHLKLQAASGRTTLNTQTRKSEYKDKFLEKPENFPKTDSELLEYLKDIDTEPKFTVRRLKRVLCIGFLSYQYCFN